MRAERKMRHHGSVPQGHPYLWFAGLFLALILVYGNHFYNRFHFDDFHTVVYNPAISKLTNIPHFFADARTFSVEPLHQTYRPLVTASLALDFAIGQGNGPFWFHFSTFVWFLVQLILMYALFMYVLQKTNPSFLNRWLALFAVAIYGLHPVSAETVNYIIQRGDLYATLGVVAGIVVYAWKPRLRHLGLYLLPALAGMLAKPSALIFAPLLAAYIYVIDSKSGVSIKDRLISCARLSTPAFVLSAAYYYFQKVMTPSSVDYNPGGSPIDYWITQPYVTLRYFRSFFVPLYLKLDTDLQPFHSLWNVSAIAGFVFCGLLIAAAVFSMKQAIWRPVSFGLWWFIIGLIPTAVQPLGEIENDHRMFLPFVGLSLAVVQTIGILMQSRARTWRPQFAAAGLILLAALAWGSHRRNEVWHTEESLWRDNVEKSPNNARAHYGLGRELQNAGRLPEAMAEYRTTLRIRPDHSLAHNNLGNILLDMPGHASEAIAEYEAGIKSDPACADCHNDLGAALSRMPGRLPEAMSEYQAALRIHPDFAQAHYNLGAALASVPGREEEAMAEYNAALRLGPNLMEAHYGLGLLLSNLPHRSQEALSHFQIAMQLKPNPAVQQMIKVLQQQQASTSRSTR